MSLCLLLGALTSWSSHLKELTRIISRFEKDTTESAGKIVGDEIAGQLDE